ncbi:MAG: purine-cytosine permease family protein [Thermoplasmata archaeon]
MSLERAGVAHIPEGERHGRPRSLFYLWFAANLTIADFALGFVPISLGMNFSSSIVAVVIGNILGAAIVGLSAAMGPSTGYPQMMGTSNSMGRKVMRVFGLINLSNTGGWFIVNNILSVVALYLIFGLSYLILVPIFVAVVYVVAYLGHNFIHTVERILSYILGIMFLVILVKVVASGDFHLVVSQSNFSSIRMDTAFFGMIAFTYSYLMSWGPYASDYSRYLPQTSSLRSVFLNTFLGALISVTFVETVALIISFATLSSSSITALKDISGPLYPVSMLAIAIGGIAANVLNLYSASLSGLVGGIKMSRTAFVGIVAIIGGLLSLLFYRGFYQFFESFLLVLDYWISPWIAVLIVDFIVLRRRNLTFSSSFKASGVVAYLIGLLSSLPFMNVSLGPYGFTFPVSAELGGIDVSYFVSFAIAGISYLAIELHMTRKAGRSAVHLEAGKYGK